MFSFIKSLVSLLIPLSGLSPNMYWLLLKKIVWASISGLTLNLWYGGIDLFFWVHGSITITLLTVSCQKPLQYRLLTYCSRECGYSLDRDGFPSSQAQSMASVKSLVFTILPIDLHPPLFLWLCERTTERQRRKIEMMTSDQHWERERSCAVASF